MTVSHPNTDRSIDSALERRDQPVVLTWRRDNVVALGGTAPASTLSAATSTEE